MPFSEPVKTIALTKSRRCCCICHEFVGLYINVHHIVQESDGGSNDLDNAIALCLRCHGEAGHYNNKHPTGNKYSPAELRAHRDVWWRWCENNPYQPLPKSPIIVSPSEIILQKYQFKAQTTLKTHNKSEQIYYQIAIKLVIVSPGITADEIDIQYIQQDHPIRTPIDGNISITTNYFRFNGIQEEKQIIFLVLSSIHPGDVATFIITNQSKYTPLPSEQPKIIITLSNFENEPFHNMIEPGKGAILCKCPEAFIMTGFGFTAGKNP